MKFQFTVALLATGMVPQFASAHPAKPEYSLEYRLCIVSDGSNAAKAQCLDAELVRQEGAMQRSLRLATSGNNVNQRRLIMTAQRTWTSFRDQNCAMLASVMAGGSGYGLSYTGCMIDMTIVRKGELNAMVG